MNEVNFKPILLLFVAGAMMAGSSLAAPLPLIDELRALDYTKHDGSIRNRILLEMQGIPSLERWEEDLCAVVIDESVSLDGRRLAASLLSGCITAKSVEALLPLIEDPRLVHDVLMLLEPLDDPRVDVGLADALEQLSGNQRSGVISSVASRKTVSAVPALIRLVETSPSAEVAILCLHAIGTIGGEAALAYLEAGSPAPRIAAIHQNWESALARVYLEEGSGISDETREVGLRSLLQSSKQPTLRAALIRGLMGIRPSDYQAVLSMFASRKPGDAIAAATALPLMERSSQALGAIVGTVDVLPVESKMLLIQALTRLDEPIALQIARSQFEKAKEAPLALTSLETLALMGTLDDARRLLPEIREGANHVSESLDALSRIPDTSVNPWVLEQFFSAEGDVQNKLASVIARRGLREHLPVVVAQLDTLPPSAQQATYRLLGELGTEDTASSLITRRAIVSDAEKRLLDRAVVTIGRRGPTERVSDELAQLLNTSEPSEQDNVVRMIGAIENATSLSVIQALLEGNPNHEMATRSLVAWREPIAMPVLQELAINEEATIASRNAAWGTMLRISREALRHWHRNRELFWEMTFTAAFTENQIKEMMGVTLEIPRIQMVPWLEAGLEHPTLAESYAETLAKLMNLLES